MPTIPSVLGSRLKRYFGSTATASTWTDDAGVANAMQATSSRQPTVTTSPCGSTAVYFTPNRDFSGSNGDVMRAAATGASETPDYTVIGCILRVFPNYATDGTGNGTGILGIGSSRCNLYIYDLVNTKLRAAAFGTLALAEQTSGTIADGKWHRVMAYANQVADTVTLYIDGASQTIGSTGDDGLGINLGTTDIWIGGGDATAIAGLNGTVGHCFVGQSSSAFSAAEIAALDKALLEQIRRINFEFAGNVATGTSSLSVGFPTGVTGGDFLALAVVGKYPTYYGATTPTGFFQVATAVATGGVGTPGADSGSTFANWYGRVADGTEGAAAVPVTVPSGNAALGRMFRFSVATGFQINSLLVSGTYGEDNSAGTAFVATGATDPGIQAGDLVLVAAAPNTDAQTYSAQTMTCTGIGSWAAAVERNDSTTTNGDDVALVVSEHAVETGVSTGIAPVFQMTSSGTAGNQNAGAASFLRLRAARMFVMPVTTSPYVFSGIDATLTYTPVSGSYTMPADLSTYALTGNAAGLTKQSKIVAATAGYVFSGINAALTWSGSSSSLSTVYGASLTHWWFEDTTTGATYTWADDSGTADVTQGTANLQPADSTTPLSRVSVAFDNTSSQEDTLSSTTGFAVPGGTTAAQICGAFKLSAGNGPLLTIKDSGGNNELRISISAAGYVIVAVEAGGSATSASSFATATWHTFVLDIRSNDTWKLYVNGTLEFTDTTSFDSSVSLAGIDSFVFAGSDGLSAPDVELCSWAIAYKATDFTVDTVAADANTVLESYTVPKTITAGTGSFTLTGNAAIRGLGMPASVGAISLTGNAANLLGAMRLTAASASYAITGQDAGRGLGMPAAAGSLALTGSSAGLTRTGLLTAALAELALTANAAGLTKQSTIAAATGSLSLTGQDATLAVSMAASPATFALTGSASGLTKYSLITAATGAFSMTGNAAGLAWGAYLAAATGSLTLTGNAAGLSKYSRIAADTCALALTGNTAVLVVAMAASPGAFALTGPDAGLSKTSRLAVDAGSFALSGADVVLAVAMPAAASSYALTGNDAAFSKASRLAAAVGALTLTGNDAVLAVAMPATTGSYTLTGQDASRAIGMGAATGTLTITGNAADLSYIPGVTIQAATGSLTLTGNAAGLSKYSRIAADTGSVSLSGNAAGLTATRLLSASAAAITLTGNAAGLYAARLLTAASAAFTITGNNALFISTGRLVAATGSFALFGSAAGLQATRTISAATGALTLTGNDVSFGQGTTFPVSAGSFVVTGNAAAILSDRLLVSSAASVSLTGNIAGLAKGNFTLGATTALFATFFPDAILAYVPIVLGRGAAIEVRRIEPLVRFDVAHAQPLVRFDQREIRPLVEITTLEID